MKLIKEEIQDVKVLITEDKNTKKKSYVIEGVFMQAEKQNRNGRVYPFDTLRKEVERYNKEYVTKNRALGELGHPDTPSINLDRVSHIVKELHEDGNTVYGKAKVLDTPMGRIVKNLIEEGAQLGVSSRGMGSLKSKNGYQEVQEDFMLAAIDIVADPSAPNAFVNGIMEGREQMFIEGSWQEREAAAAKKLIKESSKNDLNKNIAKVFNDYFRKL